MGCRVRVFNCIPPNYTELRPQGRNASIPDLSIFELLSTSAESRMFRKTTKSMTLVYHAFACLCPAGVLEQPLQMGHNFLIESPSGAPR
ncbi:unnamed protein product [Symbiodinium sp. CCMP2592]|nr:unnamed protein product [Symbiodinium sp. CCMP2592]